MMLCYYIYFLSCMCYGLMYQNFLQFLPPFLSAILKVAAIVSFFEQGGWPMKMQPPQWVIMVDDDT